MHFHIFILLDYNDENWLKVTQDERDQFGTDYNTVPSKKYGNLTWSCWSNCTEDSKEAFLLKHYWNNMQKWGRRKSIHCPWGF
jgi:hypothetical protein